MCVLLYFSFLCLHVCAYALESNVHCGSALGPGASGLPYYCTPPVTVHTVLGGLAVWWNNKKQKIGGLAAAVWRHNKRYIRNKTKTKKTRTQKVLVQLVKVLQPAVSTSARLWVRQKNPLTT